MKLNGKVKCKQAKMLILMLAIIFISMSLLCENIVFANEGVIE